MQQRFQSGDTVYLNDVALENYGQSFAEVEHYITDVYTSKAEPRGFDSNAGCALYSLAIADTDEVLNFDLYDWELSDTPVAADPLASPDEY